MPPVEADQRAFLDHRRVFWYALAFIAATVAVFVLVGIRNAPLTFLAKVLNVLGGGIVTIPLRIVVAIYLAFRKRWTALTG